MFHCSIAGIAVDIECRYQLIREHLQKYIVSFNSIPPDITLTCEGEIYQKWLELNRLTDTETSEYMFLGECFHRALVKRGGFMLHASCISFDGKAYLFSAPSGMGKSTHTQHWHKNYGDRVRYINDDKPVIIKHGDMFYACGTPFSGKHNISDNIIVPIGAVCFVARGERDSAERITEAEAFTYAYSQTVKALNDSNLEKLITTLRDFCQTCPAYKATLTNSPVSAEIISSIIVQ